MHYQTEYIKDKETESIHLYFDKFVNSLTKIILPLYLNDCSIV